MNVDKTTLEYIKKYNLEKYIYWNSISMVFWYGKKGYPLTKPWHIATFSPLSFMSRIRMVKLGLYARFKSGKSSLKGVPADKWLKRFAGKEIAEKVFKELAEIKFGSLSSVDAEWLLSRLHEAAKTRERYAYLSCGYQELIERIAGRIRKKGGRIITNADVRKIENSRVYAEINGKTEIFEADRIISSIPPKTLSDISDLPKATKHELDKVGYKAVICMLVTSKQKVFKDYWNIFIKPQYSFGGVFSHSSLYPSGLVKGENLYYIFRYINHDDAFDRMGKKEVKEAFLKDLRKLFPSFKETWAKVFKFRDSSPVFKINYRNLPTNISDNIYLTGVYKEYPCTRTMHTALKSGMKTARFILEQESN